MTELLKDKLRVLAGDEVTLQALRSVFAEKLDKAKPDIDVLDDNNILGQKYRAIKEAEMIIKSVFEEVSSYKQQRSNNKLINKGK